MEEWKCIEGTNGMIQISNEGRVRSLLRGNPNVLKSTATTKGYHKVRVTLNRGKRSYVVHREVAKAFIPNPDNLPQVNHIDGNKDNNAVSNLEWMTNQQNARHAVDNGLWDKSINRFKERNKTKMKRIIATKDGEVMEFNSICAPQDYFDSRHITDVLKGKRQHVKGWSFAYKGGDDHDHDAIR